MPYVVLDNVLSRVLSGNLVYETSWRPLEGYHAIDLWLSLL